MERQQAVTVVIPAYGPTPHLAAILDRIEGGTLAPEQVIVSHSGSSDPTAAFAKSHPRARIMHSPDRLFAGAARNRGAAAATSPILAFCDSDVLPHEDWLERLTLAIQARERRFVVGSVGMARTGGYWGTANWLSEFSEQAPWRRAGVQTGGASCNMALRRADFEAVGGFREDMTPGEDTFLFHTLRQAGLEQWFEPAAEVGHFNLSGFRAFAGHQHALGRNFARVRRAAPMAGSSVVSFPPLALGLWAAKDALVLRRALGGGAGPAALAARLLPAVILGSWLWSAGVLSGLRTGRD